MQPSGSLQPAATALIADLLRLLLRGSNAETEALVRSIEEGVRVYEREFHAFLNGRAARAPVELEKALQVAFGELAHKPRPCDVGFRLDALEARFRVSSRLLSQRLARGTRRWWMASPCAP